MRPAVTLALLFTACDPGGSYHVPGGKAVMQDGRRWDLAGESETSLRAYASWFTGSVTISLGITNNGSTPFVIHPHELHLSDRVGPLTASWPPSCAGHEKEEVVTVSPGDKCQLEASFGVHPDRDRLRTLTLTQDGVTRDGVTVPVVVKFEMDRR